jgi:hypothetical protein
MADIQGLFDKIQSHALATGLFESVNTHEPKRPLTTGIYAAVWCEAVRPLASSGLGSTSGLIEFRIRIYSGMLQEPQDAIDPNVLKAVDTLLSKYSGDFSLGDSVRCIDLLGQSGTALSANAGYVLLSQTLYRVMDITLPVIVNDLWDQVS